MHLNLASERTGGSEENVWKEIQSTLELKGRSAAVCPVGLPLGAKVSFHIPLSFPVEPDGSLMLDLPAHLLLSSLFPLLRSMKEKSLSSWGYVSLSSSCTLKITSWCLAAKLDFQGRI